MPALMIERFKFGRLVIAISMKFFTAVIAGLLLLSSPADAIVGGGLLSAEGIGRSVVTIVGSRGNFCSGALIAPTLVLTAAHCVQPGAIYKIVDYGANQQPQLRDVKKVAIHPAFNMEAMRIHRATADVALLQLEVPPKGKNVAVIDVPELPMAAGSRFTIAGIGVTVRGEGSSGGTVRLAGLVVTGLLGLCKFVWSIRSDRAHDMGLAHVPGIPVGRCLRSGRVHLPSLV